MKIILAGDFNGGNESFSVKIRPVLYWDPSSTRLFLLSAPDVMSPDVTRGTDKLQPQIRRKLVD